MKGLLICILISSASLGPIEAKEMNITLRHNPLKRSSDTPPPDLPLAKHPKVEEKSSWTLGAIPWEILSGHMIPHLDLPSLIKFHQINKNFYNKIHGQYAIVCFLDTLFKNTAGKEIDLPGTLKALRQLAPCPGNKLILADMVPNEQANNQHVLDNILKFQVKKCCSPQKKVSSVSHPSELTVEGVRNLERLAIALRGFDHGTRFRSDLQGLDENIKKLLKIISTHEEILDASHKRRLAPEQSLIEAILDPSLKGEQPTYLAEWEERPKQYISYLYPRILSLKDNFNFLQDAILKMKSVGNDTRLLNFRNSLDIQVKHASIVQSRLGQLKEIKKFTKFQEILDELRGILGNDLSTLALAINDGASFNASTVDYLQYLDYIFEFESIYDKIPMSSLIFTMRRFRLKSEQQERANKVFNKVFNIAKTRALNSRNNEDLRWIRDTCQRVAVCWGKERDRKQEAYFYDKAIEFDKKNTDPTHALPANVYESAGNAYWMEGKLKEARQYYEKAIELAQKNAKIHLRPTTYAQTVFCYLQEGLVERATALLEKNFITKNTWNLSSKIEPTKNPNYYGVMALVAVQVGNIEVAHQYYDYVKNHPHFNLSTAYQAYMESKLSEGGQ